MVEDFRNIKLTFKRRLRVSTKYIYGQRSSEAGHIYTLVARTFIFQVQVNFCGLLILTNLMSPLRLCTSSMCKM